MSAARGRSGRRGAGAWLAGAGLGFLGGLLMDRAAAAAPVARDTQLDFEALMASDVRLTEGGLRYREQRPRWDWLAGVSFQTFDLDYRPAAFDFLGSPASVDERRIGGQLGTRLRLAEVLSVTANAAAYDGFTDYRSAWLNEYYRQQFAALPGWAEASPRGESAGVGLRWEYLPASGFLEAGVAYSHDEIAPGYEIDFAGLRRGRPNLYTASYRLAAENVLTRRIRVLNEVRLTDTTNRELRTGYQGSLNLALAEHWVLRSYGGYAVEGPGFEAWYAGGSIEWQPAPGWRFGVSGRYYRDTGEIENSLFSSAAPGLTAWQVGLSVRRSWGAHSVKLQAGPYFTRYEPFGVGTAFFQYLYQNRDWALVQVAYGWEF